MKKLLCALMVAALACSLLSACGSDRSGNGGSDGDARSIIDIKGRTVVVPEIVNKVFVDWAQGGTLLMTLGAADKFAVVSTRWFNDSDMAWSNIICPALAEIPRDLEPYSNLEALLAYEPDVVITSETGDYFKAEDYEGVGFPTVCVNFTDYDSFKQSMTVIGNVLGGEYAAKAARYNDFLDSNIALVTERLAGIGDADKQSVYYIDSRTDSAYFTRGTGEIQETWIKLAGGKYATHALAGGSGSIEMSKEKLLTLDPDVIIVGSQWQADAMKLLMSDDTLAELRAVKSGQVYRNPQGVFPWCKMGPEACMQMVWAAKLLYPDKFEDIDVAQMAKGFYLDFYGSELSNENIANILAGKLSPTGE